MVDSDKLLNLSWNTSLHKTGWLGHDDAAVIKGGKQSFFQRDSVRNLGKNTVFLLFILCLFTVTIEQCLLKKLAM